MYMCHVIHPPVVIWSSRFWDGAGAGISTCSSRKRVVTPDLEQSSGNGMSLSRRTDAAVDMTADSDVVLTSVDPQGVISSWPIPLADHPAPLTQIIRIELHERLFLWTDYTQS
jgi:hypothetical protein